MKHLIGFCFAAVMLSAPVRVYAQSAQEIMANFNHEPTIEATMDAAVEYAGFSSDRLESLYRRAGAANALPNSVTYTFQGRWQDTDKPQKVFKYDSNANFNEDSYSSLTNTMATQEQDYIQHQAQAKWDLSKLVYNSEQRNVVNMMSTIAKNRDTILKSVTKIYFARRKAQIDMQMNPPSSVADRLDAELKIQEMTANLDALTGGWFSAQIKNNRR